MLVLGVEKDPLGVSIDVRSCCDEQRCNVSLPPLDGDVQRRLPCGWGGMGGGGAQRLGHQVTKVVWPFPPFGLHTLLGTVAK